MNKCLVCSKRISESVCSKCNKNPFRLEEYRDILAKNKEFDLLKKTYSSDNIEIVNINTPDFWDEKLFKIQSINEQDGMTRDRIKITADYLPNIKLKVLDIGAGYGFIEEKVSDRKNIHFNGNDISKAAIYNLKNRFNGDFKVESVYDMQYKNNKFDVVLLLEVLEHIPPSKTLFVIKSIHRMLKKRGLFILSVPMNEDLEKMKVNKNGHVRTYTKDLIISELELCGFQIIEFQQLYAFSGLYRIKKFVAKILRKRWKPNNIVIKALKP